MDERGGEGGSWRSRRGEESASAGVTGNPPGESLTHNTPTPTTRTARVCSNLRLAHSLIITYCRNHDHCSV